MIAKKSGGLSRLMPRFYRKAGASGLLRKCERMRSLGEATLGATRLLNEPPPALTETERTVVEGLDSVLGQSTNLESAHERVLEAVASHVGARHAYVFVVDETGDLKLAARHADAASPVWIAENVAILVAGLSAESSMTTPGEMRTVLENTTILQDATELCTLPLVVPCGKNVSVVGAIGLLHGHDELRPASPAFLEQIATTVTNLRAQAAATEIRR